MARRKVSKEAYNYIVETLRENGFTSTDDAVELVRPHYDFDPRAARERELRQYVGRIARSMRDEQGIRAVFLEKTKSEIVNVDTCKDLGKLTAVASQLRVQAIGNLRSYRKASKRRNEVAGQVGIFDVSIGM